MDRHIPDVWNIFSLTGCNQSQSQTEKSLEGAHVNWSQRNHDLLMKWCDRSSPCDRPRTYDRFYQKLPGNFFEPGHVDSATPVCSSEENIFFDDGDQETLTGRTRKEAKRRKKVPKYSRTITERDVRHLERHLSMKKTIRKKILRDLEQAFVEDPKEFQRDPPPDQRNVINLCSLNFDPKKNKPTDPKFLDLLRDSDDSGRGSGSPSASEGRQEGVAGAGACASGSCGRQQKYRSARERSKSAPRGHTSDSSSCGGYESAESDRDILVVCQRIQAMHPDRQEEGVVLRHCDDHAQPKPIVQLSNAKAPLAAKASSKSVASKKCFWKFFKASSKKKDEVLQ